MSKRRKSFQKKPEKNYSGLQSHKRNGSKLTPPLAALNLHLSSWTNDRLPELLWCALLISHLDRESSLQIFRDAADVAFKNRDALPKETDLGHSGIVELDGTTRTELLQKACQSPEARSALRPILLLEKLPRRAEWAEHIQQEPIESDWIALAIAVAKTLDHQSQESTDCRWSRILFKMAAGQLIFPESLRPLAIEFRGYPNTGDQRSVRPSIRSCEMAFAQNDAGLPNSQSWPKEFWDECFRKTGCRAVAISEEVIPSAGTTIQQINATSTALAEHFAKTTVSTAVDPQHEAVFGIAAYAMGLLSEMTRIGNSTGITGRQGLRAILEAFITLAYLSKKNDASLWSKFRNYGSGQAKLAFIKMDESELKNSGFASTELLNRIANEDVSLDFITINTGHWDGSNLRQLSIDAGVKEVYDKYYPWTSAYTHGSWGAIRSSVFDVCVNPLHRGHRVLRPTVSSLGDAVPDAVELVNEILSLVDAAYKGLSMRLSDSA